MAELPAPQRHALDVALLRAEPAAGEQQLQHAIGLGLLGLLRRLAEDAPTLVAIDDTHWLDPASESALGFVARRLGDERIGLFCVRRGGGTEVPLGLDRALPDGRFERLALGGLDAEALDLLLRTNLATPPSRQTVARIRRATGGNLYFALEIGRALDERSDRLAPGDELPIPPSLQELVREQARAAAGAGARGGTGRPPPSRGPPSRSSTWRLAPAESTRPSRPASSSATGSASSSPTRCSPRSPTSCSATRSGARCTRAWRRSSRTPRSARATSHWPPRRPTRASPPRSSTRRGALRRAARRKRPPSCCSRRARSPRQAPTTSGGDAGSRRPSAPSRRARSPTRASCSTRSWPSRRTARAAPRRSRALGWVCAHAEGFHVAADVFFAALAEPADDLGCASRSSPGWPGACTRRAPSPRPPSTRAPRSSWPRSSAIPACSRARSR